MIASRQSGASGFKWLTVLVLLLIGALAGLGLFSLRQDRRAAEQDARLLAEALADSLSGECATTAAEAIQHFAGVVEDARLALLHVACGETNDPPELQIVSAEMLDTLPRARFVMPDFRSLRLAESDTPPRIPDWFLTTPHEWLDRLETAEQSLREGSNTTARAQFSAIVDSDIEPLQALAGLRLAEFGSGSKTEATTRLRAVAARFPDACTPGGLAVSDLALLRAIETAPPDMLPDMLREIVSRASDHPSFLTERLFAALEQRETKNPDFVDRVSAARTVWNMERNTRALLGTWSEAQKLAPGVFRVEVNQSAYLLFSCPSNHVGTNAVAGAETSPDVPAQRIQHLLTVVPESIADTAFRRAAGDFAPRWPRYLSAEIDMAGQRFGATPWAPGTTHAWSQQPVLATGVTALSSALAGNYPFEVTVRLADPDLLYTKQRQRVVLFGVLIVAASALAVFGAWQLQKNLQAQLLLNEQKSNFVSSVSHELRAPIASVRLMAEGLERGKIRNPEKQREYFQFIGQECRRLSSLIENVLDFSRIEQGRKEYEFEPTDILTLTRETLKLMEPYASERGVSLRLETSNSECPTPNIELEADGKAIQQALVNLIDNAVKHSPARETVTIGLEMCDGKSRCLVATGAGSQHQPKQEDHSSHSAIRIHVADHGPGIPSEEHEKIFERFHRLGSELRRETQGVGIGLSIVKHIVEAHGGRVTVHSAVGRGSRFTIELPMEKNHE